MEAEIDWKAIALRLERALHEAIKIIEQYQEKDASRLDKTN